MELKRELLKEAKKDFIYTSASGDNSSDDVFLRPLGGGVTMSGLSNAVRRRSLAGGPNNFLAVKSQRPITGVVSPKRSPLGRKTDQSGVVFPRKQSKFGLRPQ